MTLALYGFLTAGHLAIAVLFLRLWRRNRATLLLAFAVAFALMAVSYVLVSMFEAGLAPRAPAYLVRLAAFLVIILGVAAVNLGAHGKEAP
jgi:hypothetical protein